jgi:hypothetical protein
MSVCDKHIENPHECTGCEIELLHDAKQRLEREVARWHTLACNHSRAEDRLRAANQRLEGEYSKLLESHVLDGETIHRLEGEVKALREALEQIEQDDWQSSQTATDFAISQTKGLLISRMKQTARAALRGNGGEREN